MPILSLTKEIVVPIKHGTYISTIKYYPDRLILYTPNEFALIDLEKKESIDVTKHHVSYLMADLDKPKANDSNKILLPNQCNNTYDEWYSWTFYPRFRDELIYRKQDPIPDFTKLAHHKYRRMKVRNFEMNGEPMSIILKRREKTTKSVLHVYTGKYNLVENIINKHTNNVTNIEMLQLPQKRLMLITVGFTSVHNLKAIYKPIHQYIYHQYIYVNRDKFLQKEDLLKVGFWNVNVNYWYPLVLLSYPYDETAKKQIQEASKDSQTKASIVTCACLMSVHNKFIAHSVDDILCDVISYFIN